MPRLRRAGEPRHVHQRGKADMVAPAQRDKALGDESAVEAVQRHHVGDRAERDQMRACRAGPAPAISLVQKPRPRSSRLTATSVTKTSPTAARWPSPERSSSRLGLTSASTSGSSSSA